VSILSVVLISIAYSSAIIFLMHKINLWDRSLAKDSIFWFVGSGFIILMNLNDAKKENAFFKKIFRESFGLILILEFISNFHVFSLVAELIIIPCMAFLAMTSAYAESKVEYKKVKNLIDGILTIVGLTFFVFSIVYITRAITTFASYSTLKTFS